MQFSKWLSGCWLCRENDVETEEFWLKEKGGILLGLNRTVRNDKASGFEFLRIFEEEGSVFFAASPNGRQPTLFKLEIWDDEKLIFINPENDFPKRIIYELLTPHKLKARIEGEDDNGFRMKEWIFEKVDN